MDTNNNASDNSEVEDHGLTIKEESSCPREPEDSQPAGGEQHGSADDQHRTQRRLDNERQDDADEDDEEDDDDDEDSYRPQIQNQSNSQKQHEIELHAKYEPSDILGHESGTQTPIEDEQLHDNSHKNNNTNKQQQLHDRSNENTASTTNSDNNNKQATTGKAGVVCVKESETNEAESIEIELESDKSLLLTSLTSLFPEATGLKYRHPASNTLRGVKLANGKFVEPIDGWNAVSNYICVFNRGSKRKASNDDSDGNDDPLKTSKQPKTDLEKSVDGGSDLVVLGLPWTTDEDSMRTYFEQYGEVVMVQVKTDPKGKSRGFGFVRFTKSNIQSKLLSQRHFIDGRWCDVRVPLSKAEADATKAAQLSRKIFVGRLPDNITTDDLRNHFSTFGTLTDVFIPKPFRNFAFVTFGTSDMAQSIFKHKHVINGTTVQISEAIPRDNAPNNFGYSGTQSSATPSYGAAGYASVGQTSIHPFGSSSYTAHQPASHHYHPSKPAVSNFGANLYGTSARKPQHQQQSSYYQMPSYGSSGPGSSMDSANYMNHSAHNDYANFGGTSSTSGYSQANTNVNGQYYKFQQTQPQQQQQQPQQQTQQQQQQQQHQVMANPNPNHSSNYSQSSYSGQSANFSRSSYGSIWK